MCDFTESSDVNIKFIIEHKWPFFLKCYAKKSKNVCFEIDWNKFLNRSSRNEKYFTSMMNRDGRWMKLSLFE